MPDPLGDLIALPEISERGVGRKDGLIFMLTSRIALNTICMLLTVLV